MDKTNRQDDRIFHIFMDESTPRLPTKLFVRDVNFKLIILMRFELLNCMYYTESIVWL